MKPSAAALVLANLVPLAGVLWWGWDLFAVLTLYWAENVVVGAWNVVKMLLARSKGLAGKLFLTAFFAVHYGLFTLGHGLFLFLLFQPPGPLPDVGGMLLVLLASHGVSFFTNFLGAGERLTLTVDDLMFRPYARVVVMHLTILGGAYLVDALGTPLGALAVLIALKTGVDLVAHLMEHRPRRPIQKL